MEITKKFLEDVFAATKTDYELKIIQLPMILLKYVEVLKFLADAKQNELNKAMQRMNAFEDFERDYPAFMAVYEIDRDIESFKRTGSYFISVCFEKARDLLSPFEESDIREHLKHTFAHEITHIVEKEIIQQKPSLCQKSQSEFNNQIANESLAEDVAFMIANAEISGKITHALWDKPTARIMEHTRRMQHDNNKTDKR